MKDEGVAGMVRSGAWLSNLLDLEVLSCGRPANSPCDCTLELAGSSLFYRISLRGGWVWILAGSLDEGHPELLFNTADGSQGWILVRRFIQALERSGIKSLRPRPIEIGEPGSSDCFVIG
jgi:hypothetical protein